MSKKVNRVRVYTNINKVLHDKLTRHCNDKNVFMNEVIETALENYFDPFDADNHEKYSKMQLARIINMLMELDNKASISLICNEESIKTFLRHTPVLELEDTQSRIAVNARIVDGHEKFMKNVIDSLTNIKPNILTRTINNDLR